MQIKQLKIKAEQNKPIEETSVKVISGLLSKTTSFSNKDKAANEDFGTMFVSIPPHWSKKSLLASKLQKNKTVTTKDSSKVVWIVVDFTSFDTKSDTEEWAVVVDH